MIASHYDFSKNKPCYPTNKTLVTETSLSIPTIVRAKKVLSERGYLVIRRRMDSSCTYTPIIPQSTTMLHEITPPAPTDQLNTHINTNRNTNRNTQEIQIDESSNEDSYNDSKNIKLEIYSIEDSWSDNPSSTIIRTDTAPAEDYWIKKADEIWG